MYCLRLKIFCKSIHTFQCLDSKAIHRKPMTAVSSRLFREPVSDQLQVILTKGDVKIVLWYAESVQLAVEIQGLWSSSDPMISYALNWKNLGMHASSNVTSTGIKNHDRSTGEWRGPVWPGDFVGPAE